MKSIARIPLGACFQLVLACAACCWGCTDVGNFSTTHGECYRGDIIDADFVRSDAFAPGTRMTLTLDTDALSRGETGGTITTSDNLLSQAPFRQIDEIRRDQLSLIQFPGGRLQNYVAFVPTNDGPPATAIISLMENGDVEVRVMRPETTTGDEPRGPLYGVFRLLLEDTC